MLERQASILLDKKDRHTFTTEYIKRREYLSDDQDWEPWALTLARRCYALPSQTLAHLPYSGGVWEQPEEIMHLIAIARRAWYVWAYKPVNKMKLDMDDTEFIAWALGDGD